MIRPTDLGLLKNMEDKKMESKIANYIREIKSKKWAEIVMNCNASGISKTARCRENNVRLKSLFDLNNLKDILVCGDCREPMINILNRLFQTLIFYIVYAIRFRQYTIFHKQMNQLGI